MKKSIFIIKGLGYFYLSLLLYLLLVSTLNYFNIINYKILSTFSFVFMILLFMYSGFYVAKKSERKGYVNGLIVGGVNIVLILLLSILLGENPEISVGIYFIILLLSSTIGGMFGINFKNKNS